jgi:hypothetical protein
MNLDVYVLASLLACSSLIACAQSPVPLINQPLVPSSVAPGNAAFNLTVNGTGFVHGATVQWNGVPLATTYISASQLTAAVPATIVAAPGTSTVTVSNPGTAAASNFVNFPVAVPRKLVAFAYPASRPDLGLPPSNMPSCQAVGDFNSDGRPDIAIGEPQLNSGSVVVLLGNGDGTFSILLPVPAPRCGAGGVVVGDFNGDGKLDMAVADSESSTLSVLLGNGDGTFGAALGTSAVVGSVPVQLAMGDFNGDGNLDLAVTNSRDRTISVLLGKGDATFRSAPASPFAAVFNPVVADFNHDGKLDLATIGEALGGDPIVAVSLGNGDGTFTAAPGSPVSIGDYGRVPAAMAVADFNGDRKLDLAVASGGYETVAVLQGNGDGTFSLQPGCCGYTGILARNDAALGVGDFSGGGKLDLALANEDDMLAGAPRYVTLFEGNGAGAFTPGVFSILQDAQQANMVVADFNGDGQLDIAMTDAIYAEETILLQSAPPGNGPDISIAPFDTPAITVKAGESASFPIKVTALDGFTGIVSYAVSGLPAGTTASLSTYRFTNMPDTSDFYVDTMWSIFRLNVQTSPQVLASSTTPRQGQSGPLGIPSLLFGLTFIVTVVPARRRLHNVHFLSIAPLALLLPLLVLSPVSCGGNGRASTPPQQHLVSGTPSGTYTLTVTATSGHISHSTAVTLKVQ